MKHLFTAVFALLLFSADAEAFEWSGLLTAFSRNIKAIFSCEVPAATAPKAVSRPGDCDFPVNIPPGEAKRFIETKHPMVIDIRTPEEHAAGHLETADMNMDFYAPDFKDKLAALDRSAKYLIYCRSGGRSGRTLVTMKDLGFTEAHDIAGGINAWTAAGFPVVK